MQVLVYSVPSGLHDHQIFMLNNKEHSSGTIMWASFVTSLAESIIKFADRRPRIAQALGGAR